ncbi:MAG: sigma-70 family RNA polymerase sigma factor, partial [Candidatus Bipolaricaulia bacterium]
KQTQNRERDLELMFRLLQKGSSDAERRIVEAKFELVQAVAAELSGLSQPSDELIQAGYISLLNAIHSFNPSQKGGFGWFDNYATLLIQEGIRRHLQEKPSDEFPEWIQMLSGKVRIAIAAFFEEHSRFPSVAELSNELNIKQAGILEILKAGGAEEIDADKIRSKRPRTFKLSIEDMIRIARAIEKVSKVQRTVVQRLLRIGKSEATEADGSQVNEPDEGSHDERKYLEQLERELDHLRNFITAIDTINTDTDTDTDIHEEARIQKEDVTNRKLFFNLYQEYQEQGQKLTSLQFKQWSRKRIEALKGRQIQWWGQVLDVHEMDGGIRIDVQALPTVHNVHLYLKLPMDRLEEVLEQERGALTIFRGVISQIQSEPFAMTLTDVEFAE